MFSKACEYGIRAMVYITRESSNGRRASQKAVAKEIDSPEAFTAKILQKLTRMKLLTSVMGPTGGFEIESKQLETTTLSEVVNAIDGDQIYKGCALGLKSCNAAQPCPLHNEFVSVRNDLKVMLQNTKLKDLAQGLETGITFLKR